MCLIVFCVRVFITNASSLLFKYYYCLHFPGPPNWSTRRCVDARILTEGYFVSELALKPFTVTLQKEVRQFSFIAIFLFVCSIIIILNNHYLPHMKGVIAIFSVVVYIKLTIITIVMMLLRLETDYKCIEWTSHNKYLRTSTTQVLTDARDYRCFERLETLKFMSE